MKNKIYFNLNTYQVNTINFEQVLVVGQKDAINLAFDFGTTNPIWNVHVVFERPDGEKSNNMLAVLNGDTYDIKIGSWFTDHEGIGKIYVRIQDGDIIKPFSVVKVPIGEGLEPVGTTIKEEQYNALLLQINNVNNKLEAHINDKDNPHNVTADQLNVYEKEHVDLIDGRLVVVEEELPLIKTDITNIKNKDIAQDLRLDDLENDKADKSDIVLINTRLTSIEQELLRLAQDKFDKIPLNNIPFLNALGKVDARYLDVGEDFELFTIVMELPPISEAILNKIYLVPTQTREQEVFNSFTEYFVWEGKWETLGSVGISLEDYYTKDEIDLMLGTLKTWVEDNYKLDNQTLGRNSANEITINKTNKLIKVDNVREYLNDGTKYLSLFNDKDFTGQLLEVYDDNNLLLYVDTANPSAMYENLLTNEVFYLTNQTQVNGLVAPKWDKVVYSEELGNYVLKEAGKGLSTNDYTNTDKQSVEKIPAIEQDILDLESGKVDKNNAITAGTKTKITYDAKGLVTGGADLVESDIPPLAISKVTNLQSSLDLKANKTELNNYVTNSAFDMQMLQKLNIKPNGSDLLIVDNKISPIYMDSLFITDIEEVDTIAQMLALTNLQQGDICIVQEENASYVLKTLPANDIDNWAKLLVQPSVISVAGKTGVVVLGMSDISGLDGALNERLLITTFEAEVTRLEGLIGGKAGLGSMNTFTDMNTFNDMLVVMGQSYFNGGAYLNEKIISGLGNGEKPTDAVNKRQLDTKVDKVTNSRLMTNAEGTKLAGIEAGAQKNVGVEFTQTEKTKLAGIATGADKTPTNVWTKDNLQFSKVGNDLYIKVL